MYKTGHHFGNLLCKYIEYI